MTTNDGGNGSRLQTGGSDASILRARARALAQQDAPVAAVAPLEVLEFRVGRERLAVESRHVGEVLPLVDLTPVPCTPDFVLGIVNVRGRIVAVLDVQRFCGRPVRGLTDFHQLIVVQGGGLELALAADGVEGVRQHAADTFQPLGPAAAGPGAAFLRGVTAERLLLLDVERICSDARLSGPEQTHP